MLDRQTDKHENKQQTHRQTKDKHEKCINDRQTDRHEKQKQKKKR